MPAPSITIISPDGEAYRAIPAERITDLFRLADGTTRIELAGDDHSPTSVVVSECFLTAKDALDRALAGDRDQKLHYAVPDPRTDCGG